MAQAVGTVLSSRTDLGSGAQPQGTRPLSGMSAYTHRAHLTCQRVGYIRGKPSTGGKSIDDRCKAKFYMFAPIGERQLYDEDIVASIDMSGTTRYMQTFRANAQTAKVKLRAQIEPAEAFPIDDMTAVVTGSTYPGVTGGAWLGPSIDMEPGWQLVLETDNGGDDTIVFNGGAATLLSGNAEPFTISPGNDLSIATNGGPPWTVTFGADTTAAEVCLAINNAIGNMGKLLATDAGGLVHLETTKRGAAASIEITGGTAQGFIGLPSGVNAGSGNVDDIDNVSGAEVISVIEAGATNVNASAAGFALRLETQAPATIGASGTLEIKNTSTADLLTAIGHAVGSWSGTTGSSTLAALWQLHSGSGTFALDTETQHDGASGGVMRVSDGFNGVIRWGAAPAGGSANDFKDWLSDESYTISAKQFLSFWVKLDAGAFPLAGAPLEIKVKAGHTSGATTATVDVPIFGSGWEHKLVPLNALKTAFGSTDNNGTPTAWDLLGFQININGGDLLLDDVRVLDRPGQAVIVTRLHDLGATAPGASWAAGTVVVPDAYVESSNFYVTPAADNSVVCDVMVEQSWGVDNPLTVDRYYGLEVFTLPINNGTLRFLGSGSGNRYGVTGCGLGSSDDGGATFTEVANADLWFEIYAIPSAVQVRDFVVRCTFDPSSVTPDGNTEPGGMYLLEILYRKPNVGANAGHTARESRWQAFGTSESLNMFVLDATAANRRMAEHGHTEQPVFGQADYVDVTACVPGHSSVPPVGERFMLDMSRYTHWRMDVGYEVAFNEPARHGG